jgi:hypothetical protein
MGSSVIAVLTLYSDSPGTFNGDQGRLVQMVAPHLGAALHAAIERAGAAAKPTVPEKTSTGRELRLVSAR